MHLPVDSTSVYPRRQQKRMRTRYEAISRNHLRKNNFHHPSIHRCVGVKSSKAKIYTETPHSQASPLSSSAYSTVSFLFPIRRNLVCNLVRSIGLGPAVDLSQKFKSWSKPSHLSQEFLYLLHHSTTFWQGAKFHLHSTGERRASRWWSVITRLTIRRIDRR